MMASSDETFSPSTLEITSKKKRKRVLISLETKAEIVKRIKNGESMRSLATEYNLGYTTVRDLRDNSERILSYVETRIQSMLPINKKIMKEGKQITLDEKVFQWYSEQKALGIPVTDQMMCDRAILVYQLEGTDKKFSANASWLQRFKIRHGFGKPAEKKQWGVPDLSERMGMEGPTTPTKLDGSSNYLTCSPLLAGMPGLQEDFLPGPGPSSSSHDRMEGDGLQGDYEPEENVDVKSEPVFNVSPEICEDENSENNTQCSSDRPSCQSSPTPPGMAGPYLLKKETHCTTILDQLLRDDTFCDVTLTAEGQNIRAHKIVLCLASAYFRQVLSKESTIQNVIVFRDIKFSELKNLINFIYTGEATVDAAELESFMKTAQMLEVNSLCDGQSSLPKNFFSRNKEADATPHRPKASSSSKRPHQAHSANSPPTKSRKTNENSFAFKSAKSSSQPSTSSGVTSSTPPTIKSEPLPMEETIIEEEEEEFHARDGEVGEEGGGGGGAAEFVDSHAKASSPSQYLDPSETLDRIMEFASSDKVPPGKCPFCPSPQQLRKGPLLTNHVHACHPDKVFFCCDICSTVFLNKFSFKTHRENCNR